MGFVNKRPPVSLKLQVKEYNLLLTILERNQLLDNELIVEDAKKLYEKLLKYSIPITDDDSKTEYVHVGFYAEEAKNMVTQFLVFYDDEVVDRDYYTLLLEIRHKYLESKNARV